MPAWYKRATVSSDPRIGTTFSHYRLDEQIGRGGMGVVYLAYDLRLDRRVAVKVMASEVADDPSFRDRFEREARMAAAIDHPNIIPIYDTGEEGSVLYLVMRFIRGTDLGKLLRETGPLSDDRTVSVLRQVAGALDAAHEDGIVHRDVKPANILIASGRGAEPTDRVYLTDFGLTKRFSEATNALTVTGLFVGTIDYVAPEQVQAGDIDGRADQYSLGCVAYESLTGATPFAGTSGVATVFAHMQQPPPLVTDRRPDLTAEVDAVIATVMAKSPADRYASCEAFVDALAGALEASGPRDRSVPPVVVPLPATAQALPPSPPPSPTPPAPPADEGPPSDGGGPQPPDGSDDRRRRKTAGLVAGLVALALVVGGVAIALNVVGGSDDGPTSVTGTTNDGTRTVSPPPECDVSASGAATSVKAPQIFAMGSNGSDPVQLSEGGHDAERTAPSLSPDCAKVVYSRTFEGQRDIFVLDVGTAHGESLTGGSSEDVQPEWSPDGRQIVFSSDRSGDREIWVMSADGSEQERLTHASGDDLSPSWSSDGSQVTYAHEQDGAFGVFVMDATGSDPHRVTPPEVAGALDPVFSPDGRTIAFSAAAGSGNGRQIFTIGANGSDPTQLTGPGADTDASSIGGVNSQPAFSPDGTIVFISTTDGNKNIYVMDADGSGAHILTGDTTTDDYAPQFSRDGTHIVFIRAPVAAQTTTTTTTAAPSTCVDLTVSIDDESVSVSNQGDCLAD